jgi:hypothetical protein
MCKRQVNSLQTDSFALGEAGIFEEKDNEHAFNNNGGWG